MPVYFHNNIKDARQYAFESSFTTHPGYIAGEACSFMAYLIVNGINNGTLCDAIDFQPAENVKKFINILCDEYKKILENENELIAGKMNEIGAKYVSDEKDEKDDSLENKLKEKSKEYKLLTRERDAKKLILRLIESKQPENGLEECWNWKCDYKVYQKVIINTFYNRSGGKELDRWTRKKYNGYPVNADYWGSYCMDGLAMGLHCVYHSVSFADAIEKCVNLLGDADSTGSIGGQIAGSIYGFQSVVKDKEQKFLFDQLVQWDDYDFAFRGLLLYILGDDKLKKIAEKTE
eukprot:85320_1